jgi:hypothetical protein
MRTELLLLLLAGMVVFYMMSSSAIKNEGTVSEESPVETSEEAGEQSAAQPVAQQPAVKEQALESVAEGEGADLNDAFNSALPEGANPEAINFQTETAPLDASKLLPDTTNVDEKWAPNIKTSGLINPSKFVTGVNTVGSSLKNPSYDIRGGIAVAKVNVCPWNNSTIDPDNNIKSLM